MNNMEKRLSRMEQERGGGAVDIAAMLDEGRRAGIARMREIGLDAYEAEYRARWRARVAEMEAVAATRRLGKIEQIILDGLKRVVASNDREAGQ